MLLFTRALLAAAVLSSTACSVYEPELPYSNSTADSSVGHDACTSATEVCNGKDDDCDGTVDEEAAVAKDCGSKLLNVPSICESGFCLRAGACNDGFFNCDGMPDNGCESSCPCTGCDHDDAGPSRK